MNVFLYFYSYSRKFFLARNYGEVIARTKEVHKELKSLGCFRAGCRVRQFCVILFPFLLAPLHVVDLTLDKDPESGDDDHLLIKIEVQELDWVPWKNYDALEFLWNRDCFLKLNFQG